MAVATGLSINNVFVLHVCQDARVDELEAQLQSTQADLKSARKRIEQLHGALKDHEEEYSGDEDQYNSSRGDSLDHLSSGGSSYGDDDDSLDFSDTNDELEDEDTVVPRSRGLDRNKLHLSPARSSERKRSSSKEPILEEDEFEAARKARQRRLKELEEEEKELEASRKARQERLRNLDAAEEVSVPRSRVRREPLKDRDDKSASPEPVESKVTSSRAKKKMYDSDDDDDLEEFLLKQRERMKNLEKDLREDDDDDDDPVSTIRASKGISSTLGDEDSEFSAVRGRDHVSNGKANGVHSKGGGGSREGSEDPPRASQQRKGSVDEEDAHSAAASRYRRKRQRRRTIEQLTSPEHTANGVDL